MKEALNHTTLVDIIVLGGSCVIPWLLLSMNLLFFSPTKCDIFSMKWCAFVVWLDGDTMSNAHQNHVIKCNMLCQLLFESLLLFWAKINLMVVPKMHNWTTFQNPNGTLWSFKSLQLPFQHNILWNHFLLLPQSCKSLNPKTVWTRCCWPLANTH
jgi:hypothetical protein